MKSLLLLLFLNIIMYSTAQSPEKFTYQSVIRDASGNLIQNSNVGVQISIRQGSPSGTIEYQEQHLASTNNNGLISLEIGAGNVIIGSFSAINWAAGPFFIETDTDPLGGTNYSISGVSQFLSVPYSLYSSTAENVVNDQVDDADADPSNELQDISLTGSDLSITAGSTVDLSVIQDGVIDSDADPNNEIQIISFSNDTLYLSNGGMVYLGNYGVDLVDDLDNDTLNEIQSLSIINDTVSLSMGGGSVVLPEPVMEESDGSRSGICSGNTAPGVGWVQYSGNSLYIDISTNDCNFSSTPRYFTSIGGNANHFLLIGVTSIYNPTPTGFRIYVSRSDGMVITPTDAANWGWFVNWSAIGD